MAVVGVAEAIWIMEERLEGPEDPGKATLTEDLREDQLVNEFLRDLEEVSVVLSALEMSGPREEAALDCGDSGWPKGWAAVPVTAGMMLEDRRDFTNTLGTNPTFSLSLWAWL